MVARSPFHELEGSCSVDLGLCIRTLHGVAIDDIHGAEEIEYTRAGPIGCQHYGVLIRRVNGLKPGGLLTECRDDASHLRIANAHDVVLDVVAGQLATVVELHAFPQAEPELLQVAADVPALREHWPPLARFA